MDETPYIFIFVAVQRGIPHCKNVEFQAHVPQAGHECGTSQLASIGPHGPWLAAAAAQLRKLTSRFLIYYVFLGQAQALRRLNAAGSTPPI
ncbi:MAG: hypothetical protein IIB62_10365 [Proteobacteria bacterium]|nr:hypothetical protein [Pseudomonadota bacterium]